MYKDLMGATSATEKRAMPDQGVWVSFVDLPNSQIELIEPYGENSPIHAFLEKNPKGGQHHVCFEVPDIYVARDEMKTISILNLNYHVTIVISQRVPTGVLQFFLRSVIRTSFRLPMKLGKLYDRALEFSQGLVPLRQLVATPQQESNRDRHAPSKELCAMPRGQPEHPEAWTPKKQPQTKITNI